MGTPIRRDRKDPGSMIEQAVTLIRHFVSGLKALFHKQRRSRELESELRAYLDAATEDNMRRGMSFGEARRAAQVELGSVDAVKEEVLSGGWESALESLWQDIRYAGRQLRRSYGFSAVAILALALGIGANTAIFTLVQAVMLKQLPISHPERLYRIGEGERYCCEWGGLQDSWGTFDYAFYKHLRDSSPVMDGVAAFSGNTPSFTVRRSGSAAPAQTMDGEYVSGNYFTTLGLDASACRLLAPADDRPGPAAVAVISYRTWQQRFAGDPSVMGSLLVINNIPISLIGVAPRGFEGARFTSSPPEFWMPLSQEPTFAGQAQNSLLYSSGMAWLYLIGRLKPQVTPMQAASQLSADLRHWLLAQGRGEGDDRNKIGRQHIRLTAGGTGVSSMRSDSEWGLILLSCASGVLLLIACANLANLLLARSASRRHQTALRLALGATRSRLIRAALTESVLLSLLGGAVGVLLAFTGTKAILLIVFRGASYIPVSASPSLPVLGFALALSLLTGVAFGLAPAFIGSRREPSEGLRTGSRTISSHSSRPQKMLVVTQAALSVLLLAIGGLVTENLRNLERADLGFATRGRLLATVSFGAAGYKPQQLPALYEQLQARLEEIPGVRSAAFSLNSPQALCCVNLNVSIGGRADAWIENVNVIFDRISPHYFATLGVRMLQGRAFDERDTQASRHVAVVDRSFARRFFPNQDPVGRHFGLSLPGHGYDYEIIGVVENAKFRNPASEQSPAFFLPYSQSTEYAESGYRRLETGTLYAQTIQVSVAGIPETYESALRHALAEINPNLSVVSVKSYREHVAIQYNRERLVARLTALFSLLALLLASVGLYGVTAFNVARRTNEIGIRMALGAHRSDVLGIVLSGAFTQVGAGLCIGLTLAMLCGRYLAHQLYGVSRFDAPLLGGATVVLAVSALLATILPAWRAASIDPVEGLRSE